MTKMSRVNEGRRDMSKGKVPCASCHEMKERDQFQKCKKKKFGLQTYCKTCQLKKVKNINSTLDRIYIGQTKVNAKMHYTKEEFVEWAMANGYPEHYKEYADSNFSKETIPSIGRIDVREDYTLDNLQLIKWNLKLLKKSLDSWLTSPSRGVKKAGSRQSPRYYAQQTIDGKRVVKYFKEYINAITWKRNEIDKIKDTLRANNVAFPKD